MASIFEYAIIRLVPEAFRGEQVNIGLVVFAPDRLDVRLNASPRLVRALGVDPGDLDWIPRLLTENDDGSLTTDERYRRLSLFPGFVLSEKGWFEADTPKEYEDRVTRIIADYIDRPRASSPRKRQTSLIRDLKSEFRGYAIMGRVPEDLYRHKVVSNVAVGPAGRLHVDFLVRNGVYHATETADFRNAHSSGLSEFKDMALASVTLQYAREQLGANGTKCYFVYAAPSIIEDAIAPALQIADRVTNAMFNFESADDRGRYLDVMLEAAGSPTLLGSGRLET